MAATFVIVLAGELLLNRSNSTLPSLRTMTEYLRFVSDAARCGVVGVSLNEEHFQIQMNPTTIIWSMSDSGPGVPADKLTVIYLYSCRKLNQSSQYTN